MFTYTYNLTLMLFLLSCLMFSLFYKHLLLSLISLEFMMLNTLLNVYTNLMKMNLNLYFMSMFMVIMISESIMGLSLLIHLVRSSGNDYLKTLNLMKW